MRPVVALFALCFICAAPPAGAGRDGFVIRSVRSIGMGGAGVALDGAYNAFFYNPALLSRDIRTRVRVLEVHARADRDALAHFRYYEDNWSRLEQIDRLSDPERSDLLAEVLELARERTSMGIDGAGPFSIVRRGFSLGVFERAMVAYRVSEGAASIPTVHADAIAEGEVVMGTGARVGSFFGMDLGVGANIKYLYRAVSTESMAAPVLEVVDDVAVYHGWAVGVDLGLLVSAGDWALGAGFYDVNWPEIDWNIEAGRARAGAAPDSAISPSWRLGVAWSPRAGIAGLVDRVRLAADLDSPLGDDAGLFKKIFVGAEARLFRFVRLRGGIHQGYPTVGAAVSLKVLELGYAYGGEELGRQPGQLPDWSHHATVALGWGF